MTGNTNASSTDAKPLRPQSQPFLLSTFDGMFISGISFVTIAFGHIGLLRQTRWIVGQGGCVNHSNIDHEQRVIKIQVTAADDVFETN